MVLKARKDQIVEFTDLQKRYMDIVVEEYGGVLPYGAKAKIAKQLGCNRKTLYDLDMGIKPGWIEEKNKRIRNMIPLLDPDQMIALLQHLYWDKIRSRKAQGLDMTGKDPVDIIDQARRIQQGKPATQVKQQQNILDQSTNINLVNLSDEDLASLKGAITQYLRNVNVQQLEEAGNIVDGTVEHTVISPAEPSRVEDSSEGDRSRGSAATGSESVRATKE